jgi:two-component system LytT family sensor kinase
MYKNRFHIRNYFIVYCALWILWICLHILILNNNGISIFTAITDSIISNLTLFIFCVILSNILRFYQPGKNSSKYLFIWCLAFSSIWFLLVKYLIPLFLYDDVAFMFVFTSTLLLRFILANIFIGGSILLIWVWENYKNQQDENQRHLQALQLAKDAELAGLRQQLQPHFLFNSLNSISALAGRQPELARLMIQQLSDFLRGTLRKDESILVSLSSEISNVGLYLEIEKVRFGNRLNTQIQIDDSCLNKLIPPLLLQPVVENAIKFGLYETLGDITISIQAEMEQDHLVIEVKNPFSSEYVSASKGVGFGLTSLSRRLFLLFNRSDLLKTSIDNSIFTCRIIIPQIL